MQQVRGDGNVLTGEESVPSRSKYFEELMNEQHERERRVEEVETGNEKLEKLVKMK